MLLFWKGVGRVLQHISLFLFPIRPWDHDRQMSPDIEAAHTLLREEKARDSPHLSMIFLTNPAN